MSLPAPGTRLWHSGNRGTVRFVGPVDGTSGIWLGVEWDDPARGRHSGTKDGKHYFSCRIPNSGTFLRPSAHIDYGVSFLEALRAKYIDLPQGPDSVEMITLGSSNGAIRVEAANLDKIRQKFSDLSRLREVSLDGRKVVRADDPEAIKNTCANIGGLNLTQNLIPDWDTVAEIASGLPRLVRLELNANRLQPCRNPSAMMTSFEHLKELHLNETLISWTQAQTVICLLPRLEVIELGYNRMDHLIDKGDPITADRSGVTGSFNSLQSLNLDANELCNWEDIISSLQRYKQLSRLILNSNTLQTIPFPTSALQFRPAINFLSLSSNQLNSWTVLDALADWFPMLEILHIHENPFILQDKAMASFARQLIIASIPSLKFLNGTAISSRERTDSELFYISYITRTNPHIEASRQRQHPQLAALRSKHDIPEEAIKQAPASAELMKNRLIALNAYQRLSHSTPIEDVPAAPPVQLRVLPSMQLSTLRQKLRKVAKIKTKDAGVKVWIMRDREQIVELANDRDAQDIGWLGLEQESSIIFEVDQ
ncbi:hypothetical protein CYLTODRAFT_400351 [Cylindrobasidium torrendii FP15055 ss-10]|uniref:CAP-Gly domain-containing protein n=1 Tax=Cylindrobasidium torrendii FP15055 ss-10 TaxID=1314674 RepID=A0A0D7B5J8_9AGAR|nr:hypothetical protein CYLTODRAFT_400351 [Cylindrobasidium torrendii FP15055 ss-10]